MNFFFDICHFSLIYFLLLLGVKGPFVIYYRLFKKVLGINNNDNIYNFCQKLRNSIPSSTQSIFCAVGNKKL